MLAAQIKNLQVRHLSGIAGFYFLLFIFYFFNLYTSLPASKNAPSP